MSSSEATGQPAPGESDNDSAPAGMAGPLAFDDTIGGIEPLFATGGTSNTAPAGRNAAAHRNEVFTVADDDVSNGLPHSNTAEGDPPHLPDQPASPAALLSPSDPALSSSAVVIPPSDGPAFEAAGNSAVLPDMQAPLRAPLTSGRRRALHGESVASPRTHYSEQPGGSEQRDDRRFGNNQGRRNE